MKKIYFEDRASEMTFRLHIKKEFIQQDKKEGRKEIHLSITTHYGDYQLFALEEQTTLLDRYEGNTKVNPCFGGFVFFTWSKQELTDYIKKTYDKDPIYPKDFDHKIALEKKNLEDPKVKALSWKFPEIRKKLKWG